MNMMCLCYLLTEIMLLILIGYNYSYPNHDGGMITEYTLSGWFWEIIVESYKIWCFVILNKSNLFKF